MGRRLVSHFLRQHTGPERSRDLSPLRGHHEEPQHRLLGDALLALRTASCERAWERWGHAERIEAEGLGHDALRSRTALVVIGWFSFLVGQLTELPLVPILLLLAIARVLP